MLAACSGNVSLGGEQPSSGDSGTPGKVPPGTDAGSKDSGVLDSGTDTSSPDASPDSGPPSSCGGVCLGQTMGTTPVTNTLNPITGTWALCSGNLAIASSTAGGFPADTAGMEVNPVTNIATLMVSDGAGGLKAGVGQQYIWPVKINSPQSSTDSSITELNFTNSETGDWVVYTVTAFPASDGCGAAMHLSCNSSGIPAYQSDFVQTAPGPIAPVPQDAGPADAPIPVDPSDAAYVPDAGP